MEALRSSKITLNCCTSDAFKLLVEKENDLINNYLHTPLMYLCNNAKFDQKILQLYPEIYNKPGNVNLWTQPMSVNLLVYGAEFINLNIPEFQ